MYLFLVLLAFLGGLVLGGTLLLWISDAFDPLNGNRKSYLPTS